MSTKWETNQWHYIKYLDCYWDHIWSWGLTSAAAAAAAADDDDNNIDFIKLN